MKRVRINLLAATVVLFGAANLASAAPAAHRAPFIVCDAQELGFFADQLREETCQGRGGDVTIVCVDNGDGTRTVTASVKCRP
jgi:hypothetical protein